jgi:outer membrane protein
MTKMHHGLLATLFLLCCLFSICAQADVPSNAMSLDEAFQSAIKRTESIKNQDELIVQAEEKYKQAIGSILPTVQGLGTYFQQQTPPQYANLSANRQATAQLQAHQYLFQGTKEYAGLRQTKDTIHEQEDLKKQALLQLYESTAQAYYSVLSADKGIEDLKSEIPLYEKWIKQLRQWIQIGRSREPDVLTIEASMAQLQAQLQQEILLAQTNREAFMFITGLPENTVVINDVNLEQPILQLPDALGAIDRRPEITSQKLAIEAAEEGVNIAKGGHLPTLDITGDYYFNRPNGIDQGVNWDFQLNLVIPIFAGGVIQSQVRAAASQERQAELTLDTNHRQVNQSIKTIYDSAIQDREQVKALVLAKEVSFKNYQAQEHDYKLGLVTNIDVLTALTTFAQSEQALDTARFTAQYDYSRLIVETGQLPTLKF